MLLYLQNNIGTCNQWTMIIYGKNYIQNLRGFHSLTPYFHKYSKLIETKIG